jgi:hypothetical protein
MMIGRNVENPDDSFRQRFAQDLEGECMSSKHICLM